MWHESRFVVSGQVLEVEHFQNVCWMEIVKFWYVLAVCASHGLQIWYAVLVATC